MKPAIRVDNISKKYRVGSGPKVASTLTETLTGGARRLANRLRGRTPPDDASVFWALQGVSFDVQPGEVVGVIGHNGAGKSTLLKVLSRIVEPTSGRAEVRGRLGSLLEVGTGFHPELTGRENVYMNGSLLGMSRREIARKFDEIVAFSGVEAFLDTPVKRYSSGMSVRLAFAVAAHLEPEILIVDEVLAVGDATFQRRCIDRMTELARSGRTILFVSHNMQLIPQLCRRAVLLKRGRVERVGPSGDVTREYLSGLVEGARSGDLADKPRTGSGKARFARAWLADDAGRPIVQFTSGDDLIVRTEIESTIAVPDVAVSVILVTQHGNRVVTSWTKEVGFRASLAPGRQALECRFRNVTFRPGHTILAHLWLAAGEVLDSVENAVVVDVGRAASQDHLSPDEQQGVVVFDYEWREVPCSSD
ncbi:MAG TPA: ABC transporter ATP-binding protein [Gemmataceae bacterium]|nr:ABC transporter ATP-binding protein [Gemmataceae bacterium]